MIDDIIIYTDGACNNLKEPHYGGWAFVLLKDGKMIDFGRGACMHTTNNRMEMRAIISALMNVPDQSQVTVFTDSQYCIGAFEKDFDKNVKNADMIERYYIVVGRKGLDVEFVWIKGHNGDRWNEMVDKMANEEYERISGEKLPDFKKFKRK